MPCEKLKRVTSCLPRQRDWILAKKEKFFLTPSFCQFRLKLRG
jgi:hypothetical protein